MPRNNNSQQNQIVVSGNNAKSRASYNQKKGGNKPNKNSKTNNKPVVHKTNKPIQQIHKTMLNGKIINVRANGGGSGSGQFNYTEVIKFVLHDEQDLPINLSYLTLLLSNSDSYIQLRTFRVNYICAIFTRSTVTEPLSALSLAICNVDDDGANDIVHRSPPVLTKPSSLSKVTVHLPRSYGPCLIKDLLTLNPAVGRIAHIGYYGTGSNIVGTLYVNVTVGCEFLDQSPLQFNQPLLHVPLVDDVKPPIGDSNFQPRGESESEDFNKHEPLISLQSSD